jgi:tricarballylate dehydrogenase
MSEMLPSSTDVIVVGAGNAALCTALAAAEHGVSVLVLERAPENEAGGNSRFTAGAFRCVYNGVDDLRALMPDLTNDEVGKSDSEPTRKNSSSMTWAVSPNTGPTPNSAKF